MDVYNRYREEEKEIVEEEKEEIDLKSEKVTFNSDVQIDEQNEEVPLSEVEKLQIEINNLNDLLLRNRAELENFKRRTNEERIRDRKYALQDFFVEFINITDVFDKAVNIKTDDEKLNKYLTGFIMINKQLQQVLEENGVKKIFTKDQKFDPTYHSALETVYVEGIDAGYIVEEIITGYMYKDRVLRPSLVHVSDSKKEEERTKENNNQEIKEENNNE